MEASRVRVLPFGGFWKSTMQNQKEAFEIVRSVMEAQEEFRIRKHYHDVLVLAFLKAKDPS
jgi:hypothetical protein